MVCEKTNWQGPIYAIALIINSQQRTKVLVWCISCDTITMELTLYSKFISHISLTRMQVLGDRIPRNGISMEGTPMGENLKKMSFFMPRLQGRPGILFFGLWVRLSVRPYVRPKRFKEVFQEGVVILL